MNCYLHGCLGYVQDKERPGTGREGALGYERYTAGAGGAGAACVSFVQSLVYTAGAGGTGVACVSYAQNSLISMGAKVMWVN